MHWIPWAVAATNATFVEAVLGCSPHSVLDVGCGEGWLARALAALGLDAGGGRCRARAD